VEVRSLFGREKALYLVDNTTKVGFSWWFFFAGILAGYAMHERYGDSQFVIMVVEKYIFLAASLLFGFVRVSVAKAVAIGRISRQSALLYLIPPFGYVFTFFGAIGCAHMCFAIFA
jgi:hypothetical protein